VVKIAIVGATGLVGRTMLQVLQERNFPITKLFVVASEKSVGKKILFKGKYYTIISLEEALKEKPDIALFSAGSKVSLEWAPKFAEVGTTVIDNSSAWRMDKNIKLVVPEINAIKLNSKDKIIANPNCSTIQMVVALYPLHKIFQIKRIVVSTYQSVTGTGNKAVKQLENERKGKKGEMAYAYPIDLNCIPQIDVFLPNDYTKEEMKMVNETRKITGEKNIKVTATAVRVPTIGGHAESVNIEFKKSFSIKKIKEILAKAPGVKIVDDIQKQLYPMPIHAHGSDLVFVGRIRKDESNKNSLNLWIVSDNLRKGAATNAVQIAEYVNKKFK
jgi:aspartate-semialdehyde dehydrogenase